MYRYLYNNFMNSCIAQVSIFFPNRYLFDRFPSFEIESKSCKSTFRNRIHISNAPIILSIGLSRFVHSHSALPLFPFHACLLIAAFCLQNRIIVTAVECSLRGIFVSASAFLWMRDSKRTARARLRDHTRSICFDSNYISQAIGFFATALCHPECILTIICFETRSRDAHPTHVIKPCDETVLLSPIL